MLIPNIGVVGRMFNAGNIDTSLSRSNAEYLLAEILHDIVKYSLTGKEYTRLCELANSDSDLSENEEYLALETKAKEPILSALDEFSFADCFVALMQEKFSDDDSNEIKRFDKNNANISIGIIFVALAFDNDELKTVLQNELTGKQIHIIEKWQNFIYDEISDETLFGYPVINKDTIRSNLRDKSKNNDEIMREIRKQLGESKRESYEQTIADFEAMCEVIIGVVKNLLEQPLFELLGGLKPSFETKWENIMRYISIEIIEDSLSAREARILRASELSDEMMSEFSEVAQKGKDMLLANLATLSMNKLIALINNGRTTQILPFSNTKLNDFGNMLKGEFTGNEFDELLALIKTRNDYIDGKIDDFSDEQEGKLEALAQKARGIIIGKIEPLEATAIFSSGVESALGESN